jgi:hypothetical protein
MDTGGDAGYAIRHGSISTWIQEALSEIASERPNGGTPADRMGGRGDAPREERTVQTDVWSMVALQEDKLKRSRISHRQIHLSEPGLERRSGLLRRVVSRLTTAVPARPAASEPPVAPSRTASAVPLADRLRPREA